MQIYYDLMGWGALVGMVLQGAVFLAHSLSGEFKWAPVENFLTHYTILTLAWRLF